MSLRNSANLYYKYFSNLAGNKHIANMYALEKLLALVNTFKPAKILEIGLGIGSISFGIIDYYKSRNSKFEYHGTEANEFCLKVLPENLKEHYDSLYIYNSILDINKTHYFDLIIIDGSDSALEKVSKLLTKNGIIFIEGDRQEQQKSLIKLFPKHKFVHAISNYKEPEYGPFKTGEWSGGGKIIYINPTLKQKFYWFIDKIKSSYRNRILRIASKH